jgi:hypothetical protein
MQVPMNDLFVQNIIGPEIFNTARNNNKILDK